MGAVGGCNRENQPAAVSTCIYNVNVLSSSKAVTSQRFISLQEWRVGVEPEEGKGREGRGEGMPRTISNLVLYGNTCMTRLSTPCDAQQVLLLA